MKAQVESYARGAGRREAPAQALALVLPLPGPLPADSGLVGRDAELAALRDFLCEAAARGAARVVSGHAGSGKTELLEAAVRLATAAGIRVLRCAGARGGTQPDLAGLLQTVWPILESPDVPITERERRALEMALVEDAPDPESRSRLPFAVLDVLERTAASRPLLITVDDWDALDGPSREVLSFVARRAEGHPMAVLVAARPDRTGPAAPAGLPHLALGPLSPADSAALLRERRPGLDPQAAREVLATAAGNPLALVELPARAEDTAPHLPPSSDRLAAAMAPGAAHLPSGTRDLLLVAALNPEADLSVLLAAASRMGGAELGYGTLEPAEQAGIARCDGRRLAFAHPATAGAVVHGTDPARCRAAHAALAAVLPHDSVAMLWHLSQAAEGHDSGLAARLEAAHRRALEQYEPPTAVRLLRRAAGLHSSPEDQQRCALRAAQLAHSLGLERMARTMAHRALRRPLGPLSTLCAEALSRAGRGSGHQPTDPATWPEPADATELESALELVRLTAPAVAGGHEHAPAFLDFLDRLPEQAADSRLLYAMATVSPVGRSDTVAGRLSDRQGTADVPARDLERLGQAALLVGDPVRALDLYRQAGRRHRFRDRPAELPRTLLGEGLAHLAMGDWTQSAHAFTTAGALAREHGQSHHAAAAIVLLDLAGGLRTGTAPAAGRSDLEAARRSVPGIDGIIAAGTGWASVEGGDFDTGFSTLSTLLADPDSRGTALFALVPFAEAAEAVNAAGAALAALDRLERELDVAHASALSARLTVARAVLADDQDAEALFERGFAEDLSRWPFLEAPLRLAHGRWLRRRRQSAEARVALRRAAAAFTTVGAEARAARVAGELRASGERAEGHQPGATQAPAAGELLNPQELRIARLAARGLSNRQIGEQLDLSPRTIGAYLYRIFPRLGVTARAQLADLLREAA